jgi:hypothetical protein
MKLEEVLPPRRFRPTGPDGPEISHVANVELDTNEQVTFVTAAGSEVDVVRKSWGFYPLPSLNSRLHRFQLYSVLVVNGSGSIFLLLVEQGKRKEFEAYLREEGMTVISWLGDRVPD